MDFQIRLYTLGGLDGAILLPGSYLHLQLNSTNLQEQKVVPTPFKYTQFQSIKVNTPFMIQLTLKNNI